MLKNALKTYTTSGYGKFHELDSCDMYPARDSIRILYDVCDLVPANKE
jgi:hypothetical protein